MSPLARPSLSLLGAFALRVGGDDVGGLPRKARALLAYLAVRADARVARETVAELLWTRSEPEQARHSLRQLLLVLRRSPMGGLLASDADSLWLESDAVDVDLWALRAALAADDPLALTGIIAAAGDGLLPGMPAVAPGFDAWLAEGRVLVAAVLASALRRLVTFHRDAGAFEAALAVATRLAAMDPLDETARCLLADCQIRAGQTDQPPRQIDDRVGGDGSEGGADPEAVGLPEPMRAGEALPSPPTAFAAPPAGRDRTRWFWRGVVWAAAVMATVAGSAAVFALRRPFTHPPGILIAGFHNLSGIPGETGATVGLGDLVTIALANRHHVRLIADPPDVTEDMRDRARRDSGGRYVLTGGAAFETAIAHVTARLTDARDAAVLWTANYDAPVGEIPRIAQAIADHAAAAVAEDRDIAVDTARVPGDAHAAAHDLVALGHQLDYFTPGINPAAEQIYRVALRFDADNVDVLSHLGNIQIKAGVARWPFDAALLADADATLAHALRLDPNDVFALFNQCLLRRMQDRVPEAIAVCRHTLELDPRYPGALRELGHDLLRTGNAADAIDEYQAAIASAPFLPYVSNAYKGLGVASLALGRRDDALRYFQQAATLDAFNSDDERMWLAAVLEMDGQHEQAAKSLAAFTARHPGLEIDAGYLQLLSAPAYADCRAAVLAALARAAPERSAPDP